MPDKFVHKLGLEVQDKITGYKGIIVSRIQFLTGCNQYGVKTQELKDCVPVDTVYIDEGKLIILGDGITEKEVKAETRGCDETSFPK